MPPSPPCDWLLYVSLTRLVPSSPAVTSHLAPPSLCWGAVAFCGQEDYTEHRSPLTAPARRVAPVTGTLARPSPPRHVFGEPGLGHSGGPGGRKTGRPGEECKPSEGGGGHAAGQVPWSGTEARRLRLPHEEITERAKVLRLGRLQHGQGQDEEQAASCGRARQEPGDRRPHSNAAGSAPEEVVLGDQQASRLAFAVPEAPSPWGSRQRSLLLLFTRVPNMSPSSPPPPPPPPPLPLHPQAPLALTYRAELYKLKLHLLVCGWGGVGGADGGRSRLCLPTAHSSAPSAHSAPPPPLSWFSVFQDASQ